MTTTTNLADFGFREIKMARDLLDAWVTNGLPEDFGGDGVILMMNQNSGNVFLTNDDFDVCMHAGEGRLYSFYTSPWEGREGSFEDLLAQYDDMHEEDVTWFKELAERLSREDELPADEG